MAEDIAALRAACDAIVHDPKLQAERDAAGNIVRTFCNVGAQRVAHAMGCREFDKPDGSPIMADQMFAVMDGNASGCWLRVSGESAANHALCGGLAFAAATGAMLGELHGHIAAVYPDKAARGGERGDGPVGMAWSGTLQKDVPMVANVGKHDAEEKESAAFPPSRGEAAYFIWHG